MKYSLMVLALLSATLTWGQRSVDLRLNQQTVDGTSQCYDVQISFSGEDAVLGSQNYRIYYNSAGLKFLESESTMRLPEEYYSYRVVQHNSGIDANGIGELSFEGSLGFINATVILNDARSKAFVLNEDTEWPSVLSLCFESTGEAESHQIVLARKKVTGDYGRAFIEMSFIDESGAIASLPVGSYQDIGH